MRFDDDYDEYDNQRPQIIYMALGVAAFILLVMGIVVFANRKGSGDSSHAVAITSTVEEDSSDDTLGMSKLRAEDLDFWDMYPVNSSEPDVEAADSKHAEAVPSPSVSPEVSDEDYDDGKHYKIEYADGSSEWLKIDEKRERNTYDFTSLVANDGKLRYMIDGKKVSFFGIDVSRYQKDIDFEQVKNDGADFVMLRVGARGYQSGILTPDENFADNLEKATNAGLDVGVYFYSQAVTTAEAIEEANIVIQSLNGRKLKYPVAYDMELVPNDTSRIATLTKDERTIIATSFLNTVTAAGYKSMVYGNEEWLSKKIDLTKMPGISVWLSDESDMPDYPYLYSMWQYTTDGEIDGVNGPVNMDICFIDYNAQ